MFYIAHNSKIRIFFIIVAVIIISLSSIIAQNSYHIEHCDEENCVICCVIRMAQENIKNFFIIYGCFTFIIFSNYIAIKTIKKYDRIIQNTLIIQNIQFNE